MTRRDKVKVPDEITQHSAHVKKRSRDNAKDQERLRLAAMVNASEPMRRLAERYPRDVIGMALGVAWLTAQPWDDIAIRKSDGLDSDAISLAYALAWLDQDRKNCVRTEKILRLIQRYGSEQIIACTKNSFARTWLEGKL